jgi:hypothetical protein
VYGARLRVTANPDFQTAPFLKTQLRDLATPMAPEL